MAGRLQNGARRLKQRLLAPLGLPWLIDMAERHQQKLRALELRLRHVQEALGRIEARQTVPPQGLPLRAREFRVYSQWGEDGILQYLCDRVPIANKVFVEFGVEDYQEANTRFLLVNNNWAGLVIDGSDENVARIRADRVYWLHNLKGVAAFITPDNINHILTEQGVTGEIGVLSIDIDGMDYWIWEAIEAVRPAIVVIEYNHRFGDEAAVTVPYRADFDRRRAHHSIVYYGASLEALRRLGSRKGEPGYALVGCGSAGLNAFFVRRDLRPDELPELTTREAFVPGQFTEAHDERGTRVKMSPEEESRLARSLPLVEVE